MPKWLHRPRENRARMKIRILALETVHLMKHPETRKYISISSKKELRRVARLLKRIEKEEFAFCKIAKNVNSCFTDGIDEEWLEERLTVRLLEKFNYLYKGVSSNA